MIKEKKEKIEEKNISFFVTQQPAPDIAIMTYVVLCVSFSLSLVLKGETTRSELPAPKWAHT